MIPNRADTLRVLRLLDERETMLMLPGDADGYGTRWTLGGEQVQPAIARYLMSEGFIAESGSTEYGARILVLTPTGASFREDGLRWWAGLSGLQKLKAVIFG
jgi:hypothetical protein